MSKDKEIPELTDIVGYAKDIEKNEFDFNGLIPGKALTQNDIDNLQAQIDKLIKHKIATHSQLLYKNITKDIKKIIKSTINDSK